MSSPLVRPELGIVPPHAWPLGVHGREQVPDRVHVKVFFVAILWPGSVGILRPKSVDGESVCDRVLALVEVAQRRLPGPAINNTHFSSGEPNQDLERTQSHTILYRSMHAVDGFSPSTTMASIFSALQLPSFHMVWHLPPAQKASQEATWHTKVKQRHPATGAHAVVLLIQLSAINLPREPHAVIR